MTGKALASLNSKSNYSPGVGISTFGWLSLGVERNLLVCILTANRAKHCGFVFLRRSQRIKCLLTFQLNGPGVRPESGEQACDHYGRSNRGWGIARPSCR